MTALTYAPPTQLELPKPPARQTPRSSTQLVNCKRKLKEKSGTSRYGRLQALSYPGFKVLAEAYRLELVLLPTTSDGSDLDALAQLCATRRIRAIYAIPMLHNPFGTGHPPAVPRTTRGHRPTARTAHHRGCRVCVPGGTAATPAGGAHAGVDDLRLWPVQERCDWSALRIRTLPTQFIEAFERAIHATTWNTPARMTAIATGWLNDGTVARLETEKRVDARRRQTLARNVLDGFDAIGHPA